jgi:hypothetical protein
VTQESVTKVGVDDLGNSTTLESNKSLLRIRDHEDHADTTRRDSPSRAASAETACPDRLSVHSVDMVAACRCDYRGRSLAVAGLQSRSSLRWDRVDTHPDQASLCLPCSNVGAQTIRYDTGSSKAIIKPGKDAIGSLLAVFLRITWVYMVSKIVKNETKKPQ